MLMLLPGWDEEVIFSKDMSKWWFIRYNPWDGVIVARDQYENLIYRGYEYQHARRTIELIERD